VPETVCIAAMVAQVKLIAATGPNVGREATWLPPECWRQCYLSDRPDFDAHAAPLSAST
jgi:hypothetical protein